MSRTRRKKTVLHEARCVTLQGRTTRIKHFFSCQVKHIAVRRDFSNMTRISRHSSLVVIRIQHPIILEKCSPVVAFRGGGPEVDHRTTQYIRNLLYVAVGSYIIRDMDISVGGQGDRS